MKKVKIGICILLILTILGSGILAFLNIGDDAASSWQEQFDLGVRYLTEGKYQEAILAFSAAIEIDPNRAQAYELRGDAHKAMGDYESAREDYETALDKGAENSDDLKEKLEEVTDRGGSVRKRVKQAISRDGNGWETLRQFTYDDFGRLVQVKYVVTENGEIRDQSGGAYVWDGAGNLLSSSFGGYGWEDYLYENGVLTGIRSNEMGGEWVEYNFQRDDRGDVVKLTTTSSSEDRWEIETYTYDDGHRRISRNKQVQYYDERYERTDSYDYTYPGLVVSTTELSGETPTLRICMEGPDWWMTSVADGLRVGSVITTDRDGYITEVNAADGTGCTILYEDVSDETIRAAYREFLNSWAWFADTDCFAQVRAYPESLDFVFGTYYFHDLDHNGVEEMILNVGAGGPGECLCYTQINGKIQSMGKTECATYDQLSGSDSLDGLMIQSAHMGFAWNISIGIENGRIFQAEREEYNHEQGETGTLYTDAWHELQGYEIPGPPEGFLMGFGKSLTESLDLSKVWSLAVEDPAGDYEEIPGLAYSGNYYFLCFSFDQAGTANLLFYKPYTDFYVGYSGRYTEVGDSITIDYRAAGEVYQLQYRFDAENQTLTLLSDTGFFEFTQKGDVFPLMEDPFDYTPEGVAELTDLWQEFWNSPEYEQGMDFGSWAEQQWMTET